MVEHDENCSDLMRWAAARGITDVPRSASSSAPRNGGSDGLCASRCCELGHSLRIATFPDAGGRGLAASRPLKEGELILRVPKSVLLSMLSAKEDPQLANAMTLYPMLSSTQILTLHLLHEVAKGRLSPWYTYLVQLPRLHHTLAHFSQSAIQALQVQDARGVAQNAVERSAMDWEAARGFMQHIRLRRRCRSLNAWLWASATISSRTLHVPWDEAGTLCPIGDLFNYAPPGELYFDSQHVNQQVAGDFYTAEEEMTYETEDDFSCNGVTIGQRLRDGGYEPEYDEYCFYAHQAYETGQQVLLCYGQYNNLELLEHYGFLLGQNPNDNVHLGLPDSSEFGTCSDHLPINSSGVPYIEVNGTPSFSLLAGLRLRAVHPPLRKATGHTALMGQQISKESDILVYQWLQRKCESVLACLPTSLEDDLALMELVGSARDLSTIKALYTSFCEGIDTKLKAMIFQRKAGNYNFRKESILCDLENFLRSFGVPKKSLEVWEETSSEYFQLEVWKLALQWRIGYKHILHRCCLLCAKKIKRYINS